MTEPAADQPQPIRVLDDVTASRIAAGEVVERPASVVKELVENSLDAGATDIRVEIQAGGRRLIRVSDNGRGIPVDQIDIAVQRHATSKISSADDLDGVRTLGFRGEALASIASVTHLTLVSRVRGSDAAVTLSVDNGRITGHRSSGAPPGTSVTAENLFSAVPARLKFLRAAATESGHAHDIVTRYALAYPDRRFLLVRDGRTVFQSPGTGELEDTLIAAFGVDVARAMIPVGDVGVEGDVAAPPSVDPERVTVQVQGYVSPPHIHRATRKHIALFVNGRWVHDTRLSFAVIQAYHTLVPKGRFPIAVVLIGLPAEAVDVNVHPAKTEVRFKDARPVFAAVQRAVRSAVVDGAPVAPVGGTAPLPDLSRTGRPSAFETRFSGHAGAETGRQSSFLDTEGQRLPLLRVVGQVAQAYIVAEGPEGLYLIDQHAAHERVMYERFMACEADTPSLRLLSPETVTLTPRQLGVVDENQDAFARLGFDVEPFGTDTVLVRALPDVLAKRDVADSVRSIVDLTEQGDAPIADAFEARLVRAVCKQATVKAGQTLDIQEMRALVQQLEATESPRTCPHGRPTMIVWSAEHLAREFGRT